MAKFCVIKDFPDYIIYEDGRVLNIKTHKLINTSISGYGYVCMYLKNDLGRKNHFLHRLLAIHFIPNPKNKPHVNHIDANKKNFSLNNLEWVTPQENIKHATENLLFRHGSNHHNTNLNEEQVFDIKTRIKNGEAMHIIRKEYKITKSHINCIKHEKTWKHIKV